MQYTVKTIKNNNNQAVFTSARLSLGRNHYSITNRVVVLSIESALTLCNVKATVSIIDGHIMTVYRSS